MKLCFIQNYEKGPYTITNTVYIYILPAKLRLKIAGLKVNDEVEVVVVGDVVVVESVVVVDVVVVVVVVSQFETITASLIVP